MEKVQDKYNWNLTDLFKNKEEYNEKIKDLKNK